MSLNSAVIVWQTLIVPLKHSAMLQADAVLPFPSWDHDSVNALLKQT